MSSNNNNNQEDPIVSAKRLAGHSAVDELITSGMIVGIGSGSTIVFAVERLVEKINNGELENIICIPSSFQASQLIRKNKLTISDLSVHSIVDVTIDGADEIDENFNLIKGGGGCLTGEKILAACSIRVGIVADYRKSSKKLGMKYDYVPVEVIPTSWYPIAMHLQQEKELNENNDNLKKKSDFLPITNCLPKIPQLAKEVKLRTGLPSKAGPCVTDNNCFILDVKFGPIDDPVELERALTSIPGVVSCGLFVNFPIKTFIGQQDGTITTDSNSNFESLTSSIKLAKAKEYNIEWDN